MHNLLVAILFGSFTSATLQTEPATPPPERLDDAGVSDWLDTYIETEGWAVIAADGMAVALGSPDGVIVRADGDLQAQIRHEYYRPTTIGPFQTSSNLQTRVIDCEERRHRVISMTLFEGHNLHGQLASQNNDSASWTTPSEGSVAYRVMDRVCRAPSEGESLPLAR
jgi:hypothetical protein